MRISRTFNRAVTSSGTTLYLTDEEVSAGKSLGVDYTDITPVKVSVEKDAFVSMALEAGAIKEVKNKAE